MPESKARATVSYDGEALRTGSMDVRDLAPALLALGDLFQAANRTLNGEKSSLSVHVQAPNRKGSFPIDLDLLLQSEFLASITQSFTAADLVRLVFGSSGIIGLLQLLKKLKGQKPESVADTRDGHVTLNLSGGANAQVSVTVRKDVYNLFVDPHARQAAERSVKPLESPGIDRFDTIEDGKVIETVTKPDLPAFKAGAVALDPNVLHDGEHDAVFEIIKPALVPNKRWVLSDGEKQFGVEMADKVFQERVARRQVRFGHGDALKVHLHTRVTRGDDGKLMTTRRVVEVLDVLEANKGTQTTLKLVDE